MVSALDLRGQGPRPSRFQVTTLGKLFTVHTHVSLLAKQYKLVPAKGRRLPVTGKVTAGVAESKSQQI